jgi:hypothetical protein
MPKKSTKMQSSVEIKDLSLSELYILYQFVSADASMCFGPKNDKAKNIISARAKEIKEELYLRAYGQNPFVVSTVEGQKPEEVIASLPIAENHIVEETNIDTTQEVNSLSGACENGAQYVLKGPVPEAKLSQQNEPLYVVTSNKLPKESEEQPRFVVAK